MPSRRPHRLQELGELLYEFKKKGGIVPQAPEIEQSVLGAIFIDKSALPKCITIIGEDFSEESVFYEEKNRGIYQAVLSLYRQSGDIDTVTVMHEMKRLKIECDPVYLSELTVLAVQSAHVEDHCKILLEKRLKRDLLLLSRETELKAAVDSADIFETIDDTQARLLRLSNTRRIKTSISGSSIVYGIVDRMAHGIQEPHVPSGIKSLDKMINGFYAGDSAIIAARPSIGKAQPLDAQILTPSGFKCMGGLMIGDKVIGKNGQPCRVLGIYPQGTKEIFRVTLFDGRSTECCDDHLWETATKTERMRKTSSVKPLSKIRQTLRMNGIAQHHIPICDQGKRLFHQSVISIEPAGKKICQCIMVDAKDGLYLTDDFIVTHNTALALNLACNAAQSKVPVGFFSYEMRVDRLVQRILSTMSDVWFDKIRRAELQDYDIKKIVEAAEIIHEMPIQFVQANGMSSMQLRSEMIKMKSQFNTGIFFVDYLQLIRPKASYESQEREIAETSSAIKGAALELDVPIVTLAQLNRKVEERTSKTPSLGDLKGSGATEADADLVILLHRPGQYGRGSEANEGIPEGYAELIIAKQRDGMTGTVPQNYIGSVLRFEEPPVHFPVFPNSNERLQTDIQTTEGVGQENI